MVDEYTEKIIKRIHEVYDGLIDKVKVEVDENIPDGMIILKSADGNIDSMVVANNTNTIIEDAVFPDTWPDGGDSNMEAFSTGAQRGSQSTKPRIDLISPYAQEREGEWLRFNSTDPNGPGYGERNWEKGIPISRCIASLERHVQAYKRGDMSEDHMAAIRANTGFILHYEEMIKRGLLPEELDDMPFYELDRGNKEE